MNKHLLTVLLLLIPSISSNPPPFFPPSSILPSNLKIPPCDYSQIELGINLLQETAQDGKSVVLSPLSISMLLHLFHQAARGARREEIANLIGRGESDVIIRFHYLKIRLINIYIKDYTFDATNRFYARQDLSVKEKFHIPHTGYLGRSLYRFSYSEEEKIVQEMNEWISDKTSDKITGMITPDYINSLAGMLVLDAVNFRGTWKKQFSTNMTRNEPFHISESESKNVSMMQLTGEFPYYEDDSVKVVKLPYKSGNGKLELLLILPKIRFGLSNILKDLTAVYLLNYVLSAEPALVTIKLPKFRVEGKINLTEPIAKIRTTDIFEEEDDSAEIVADPLSFSTILHANFFEVDEKGTESDATMITDLESHQERSVEFSVDQPFLFAVVKNNATVLIAGQYVK